MKKAASELPQGLFETAWWFEKLKERNNEAFIPLFFDRHRYLVMCGGGGSGKSICAGDIILNRVTTEEGHNWLVCRKVAKTIRWSCFNQLVGQAYEHYADCVERVYAGDLRITFKNGSQIIFAGLDDVEKLKSIYNITGVWIEEASEVTEQDFNQLDIRLRGKTKYRKQIIVTFNPVSILHWLKRRFFDMRGTNGRALPEKDRKKIRTHHSTYKDNRFLPQDDIDVLEAFKNTDPYYYQVYALGQWGVLGKSVFDAEAVSGRLLTIPDEQERGHFEYADYGTGIKGMRWIAEKNGWIRIYKKPQERRHYVIGGDTAGTGSDSFVGQVLDNFTGEQVATLRHSFGEDEYAKQMYCLGAYYNDALIGIETNYSTYPVMELERLRYRSTLEINLYPNQFRAGDAVKIRGCTGEAEANNKTVIIREVRGNTLKFYDDTFTLPDGKTEWEAFNIGIKRDIPDVDIVFSHKNRLWAAKGRSIYCTNQGDPLVWADYDSLAGGSWWADTGNSEVYGITGGISYGGYPRFFSEEHIYTVYGDTPADFSIYDLRAKGTPWGESESFAVVDGMLIYLSDAGFMAYTGGYPQKIDTALKKSRYEEALAVSDGRKYYVQCHEYEKNDLEYISRHLFVYDDAQTGLWHEETTDGTIEGLCYVDSNLYLFSAGEKWTLGTAYRKPTDGDGQWHPESDLIGRVEFNDYTLDSVSKKQVKEIIIRHEVEGCLTAKVLIDGVPDPSFTKTIPAGNKGVTRITGIPKRCDRWRLRLEGKAPWRVFSIAYEYYEGSTK